MPFWTDDRAVSEVIGAVLIFGMIVIAFSSYQAFSIPAQNSEIEAKHYEAVQDDLRQVQAAIVTAGDTGEARTTGVDLGPAYPSRLFGVNAGPPSGQLRAESVGGGEIRSTDVPLKDICRLEGASSGAVPTKSIAYNPGYNHYQSGDVAHRLEETLLYQQATTSGSALSRSSQSIVDPEARSVTLYPLQSDMQSSGTGAETYRFVGGYGGSTTVTGPTTITIPTQAPLGLWEEQVATGNSDITVSDGGTNAVDITFSGQWKFNCRPVAQGGSPEQVPTADAGADTSVDEGATVELDGSSSQTSSTITSFEWTFSTTPSSGVTLTDQNTATPVVDASGANVDSDTTVDIQLEITENDGDTDTNVVTVTIRDTSSSSGTTPGLTGTAEDLPTGSTGTTQRITFSPTEETLPSGETVTIDLSNAEGGSSSSPDPVYYQDGSPSFDHPGSINTVTSGGYIIEWTPSVDVSTSKTVTLEHNNVKTQSSTISSLNVLFSRTDGDGTTDAFAVTDGTSGGGGGGGEDVTVSQVQLNNGDIRLDLRNNGGSKTTVTRARLVSYNEASTPNNKNKDPISRVLYDNENAGPVLDTGDSLEMVSGPEISSDGGSAQVLLYPERLQTKSGKYESADAETNDRFRIELEFSDGSTVEYDITI